MVGAPRKAHNARKVSGSSGRPPPRNEALGWPSAHLAWADLRLMRDSGRPAIPAHPSCSWGREEELPGTRPGWGGPMLSRLGMVGGLWDDLARPAGAPLVPGSGGLGDHPGYPWGHSSGRPAPAGGPVPLSTRVKGGQAVPTHEPPLPCCPGPRHPPQAPGHPGGSCVGTSWPPACGHVWLPGHPCASSSQPSDRLHLPLVLSPILEFSQHQQKPARRAPMSLHLSSPVPDPEATPQPSPLPLGFTLVFLNHMLIRLFLAFKVSDII